MAVSFGRTSNAPDGLLVADRPLYLDANGGRVVEHGDATAASLLVAAGHPIPKAESDRLGLGVVDGKIVQDHPIVVADLRARHNTLLEEQAAFTAKADAYKTDNAVKEIPNTMEAERVDLDARVEAARLTLARAIKTAAGNDPDLGESQKAPIDARVAESVPPAEPSDG